MSRSRVPDEKRIEKLSVAEAVTVAVRLHQEGHLIEAEELYRNILAVVPEQPDVLHFLGVLIHQLGRTDEAVTLVRRSLAAMPAHVDAWNNLGNILRDGGHLGEAEAAYRRAVTLAPDRIGPRNNLGVVLKNMGRLDEAVAEYRAALEIDPDYADAHHNLAVALATQGKHDEAVAAARRALALRPDHSHAWRNLTSSLLRMGRDAEASSVVRRWLAIDPGNPIAAHTLAAIGGAPPPERASDDYVKHVFDEFAGSFDAVMAGLEYQAPYLIGERIAAELPIPTRQLDVLDAGCGTGLCGPLLRPYARRLVGVDLSARMITRARERGGYDELIVAELIAFLEAHDTSFDVIACVDTLVYIGDLTPFLAAAARQLKPDGLLVFTVEHGEELEGLAAFRLEPTGRYRHSKSGLEDGLASVGLTATSMTAAVLRKEQGRGVPGLVVTARKHAIA